MVPSMQRGHNGPAGTGRQGQGLGAVHARAVGFYQLSRTRLPLPSSRFTGQVHSGSLILATGSGNSARQETRSPAHHWLKRRRQKVGCPEYMHTVGAQYMLPLVS